MCFVLGCETFFLLLKAFVTELQIKIDLLAMKFCHNRCILSHGVGQILKKIYSFPRALGLSKPKKKPCNWKNLNPGHPDF